MELRRQRSSIAVHGPGVPVKGPELVLPNTRTAEGPCSLLPASSCTLASVFPSCSGGRRTRSLKGLADPASSIKFTPQTAAIQDGVVAAAAGHTPTAGGRAAAGVDCAGVCPSKFTEALVDPAANDRNLAFIASGPSPKSYGTSAPIHGRPADDDSSISARPLLRFPPSEVGKRESISFVKPCGLEHLVDTTSSMPARQPPCFRTSCSGRRTRTFLWLSAAAAVLHMLGLCSMTGVSCATSKNDETQPLLSRSTRRSEGLSAFGRKIAKALKKTVVAAETGAPYSPSSGESSVDESSESGEGIELLEEQVEGSGLRSALLEVPGASGGMSPSAYGGSGQGGHDSPAQGKALRRAENSPGTSSVVLRSVQRTGSFGSAQGASGAAEAPGTSGVVTRARTRGVGGPVATVRHFGSKALQKLRPASRHGEYTLPQVKEKIKGGILKQRGAPKHEEQKTVRLKLKPIIIGAEALDDVGGAAGGAPSSAPFPQREEQPVEGPAEALAGRRQARGRVPGTSGDDSAERPARVIVVRPGTALSSGSRRGSARSQARRRLPRTGEEGRTEPRARIIAVGPPIKLPPGTVSGYLQMGPPRRRYF